MPASISAVVMVGPVASGPEPVRWVDLARRAAAHDVVDQLRRQPGLRQILVVSPDAEAFASPGVTPVVSSPAPPHVGHELARLVQAHAIDRLLYVGGGAGPLLDDDMLAALIARLAGAEALVATNNVYSSDWAGVVPASAVVACADRLPRDNMLGWVLSEEAGLPLHAAPPAAATRLDIDTPADLLVLRLVPGLQPHLAATLAALPLNTGPLRAALDILATPARRVLLAGRVSPEAWQRLNRVSRCWVRVLAEERGMVASGRAARGEVYSLLADLMEREGLEAFFARLPAWADAAFIDSRVLWAHHGFELDAGTRFASDLGRADDIDHPWVAAFTRLAAGAAIPIILGGHTLLAGDLLALCDLVPAGAPVGP